MGPLLEEEEMNLDVDEILNECERHESPPPQVKPIVVQSNVETSYDAECVQDFHFPGHDFSEEQQVVIQEINSAEYLVWSTESRKFFRKDIHDKWVRQAVDEENDHPEHDLRYCCCCDIKVCIGKWGTHSVSIPQNQVTH